MSGVKTIKVEVTLTYLEVQLLMHLVNASRANQRPLLNDVTALTSYEISDLLNVAHNLYVKISTSPGIHALTKMIDLVNKNK